MSAIYLEKARDSLKTSQTLLDKRLCNDAVSRAYYASFQMAGVALNHFGIIDINDIRQYNHNAIIGYFSRYLIKEKQIYPNEIRGYLREFYAKRMIADYEPNAMTPLDKAEEIIKKVIYFHQMVEDSLN